MIDTGIEADDQPRTRARHDCRAIGKLIAVIGKDCVRRRVGCCGLAIDAGGQPQSAGIQDELLCGRQARLHGDFAR